MIDNPPMVAAIFEPALPRTPPCFSWIQLSDIHFGRDWDALGQERSLVLSALRADLRASVRALGCLRPSVLLVTGDIADTGAAADPDEYTRAVTCLTEIADDLRIPPADILTLMGNHDVPRISANDRQLFRLIERLREGHDTLEAALPDRRDRQLLARRAASYEAFAANFGAGHGTLGCWHTTRRIERDVSVRLIGLNTALLCADDRDEGRLLCGQWQLNEIARAAAKGVEIVFVLSHHPFSWLRDQETIAAWTRRYAHLHLRGHLHVASATLTTSGSGATLIEIGAGAVHDTSWAHGRWGYNIGGLWRRANGSIDVRIWPRVWSRANCAFRQDSDQVPDRKPFITYRLPVRLPAVDAASGTGPPHRPFRKKDFVYPLPASVELPAGEVPVPCEIGGRAHEHAVVALREAAQRALSARADTMRSAYEEAWRAALASWREKRKVGRCARRQRMLSMFARRIQTRWEERPKHQPWLLVAADTGGGKTTVLQRFAQIVDARYVDLRNITSIESINVLVRPAETTEKPGELIPQILVLDALDKMQPGATHVVLVQYLRALRNACAGYHMVIVSARTAFFRSYHEEYLRGCDLITLSRLPVEAQQRLADLAGVGPTFAIAVRQSTDVAEMAGKPLLHTILVDLIRRGVDVTSLTDEEQLFTQVIEQWLGRDDADSITPGPDRLRVMQSLALTSLSTGGRPLTHADVSSALQRIVPACADGDVEPFNRDVRVCGFLKREGANLFAFQHAAFYEYCIARTVTEDLRQRDLRAISAHPFEDQVIAFLQARLKRQGRLDDLRKLLKEVWTLSLESNARGNLLKLATALFGNSDDLPLAGHCLSKQTLRGIVFTTQPKWARVPVVFEECDFTGADLGRVDAYGWQFLGCRIRARGAGAWEINHGVSQQSEWTIGEHEPLTLRRCETTGGSIASSGARLNVEGGVLANCLLEVREPSKKLGPGERLGEVRHATLQRVELKGMFVGWRIEMCSVDAPTQYALASLSRAQRPSLSQDIAHAVALWHSHPHLVRDLKSPFALDAGEGCGLDYKGKFSHTKKRALKRHVMRSLRADRLMRS